MNIHIYVQQDHKSESMRHVAMAKKALDDG